jgi:hypothetical protein
VISERFSLSLLTALLLKVVLEVILVVKRRVKNRMQVATTPVGKVGGAILLWLVLVGSKFVVLELEGRLFGDAVSLGGFFSVTLLILVLLLSRAAVRRLLQNPSGPVTNSGGKSNTASLRWLRRTIAPADAGGDLGYPSQTSRDWRVP